MKGISTINARVETVATSETYREPFKRRRCIIPANGFYEWALSALALTDTDTAEIEAEEAAAAEAPKRGHKRKFHNVLPASEPCRNSRHNRLPPALEPRIVG